MNVTWTKSLSNFQRRLQVQDRGPRWRLCLLRFTSLTVFWLRARIISADAPRTSARFIFNREDACLVCRVSPYMNKICCRFRVNWTSHFIDHCISKGLLVSSGGFAVVHLHRHHPDPWLLLFGVVLAFFSTPLHLLILNLRTETGWMFALQDGNSVRCNFSLKSP